ncbi:MULTISPECIES: TIGR02450 family Trp-rich protein [Prochlorococcus]|uniref:TIGR02450 family Trp-rich protein n=1 Tax=Prochlorococcus marinus (strain SARG / CCMP1375 / SS120) TaxID=167539 RepID=Q7VCF9_PROMA|nr:MULTISPECIES: TIGR02450 family Trp-rich protein [Prochlorococcus]AAP99825.1 Uncharacterized protein Pro_0781 [Prochlorococcus marinus subsp. marinus str. CCMP1375]KGG11829.1 hypothetical protein EV04_0854 [Prochlorococcus marinus str. LG]KGG21864.1 hypothetical protein EV08_0469 [Prochlorococcus marinus str. SS2]KGG23705.1 hypothetical protein EV09_1330 [Prochlorococcus marinus str. SS35]KGG32059.1 hypothetical protein EV10_1173 [Prochlorococcus marinus str. SS51]
MIKWPPVKAWTSINPIQGERHFVAINYDVSNHNLWVNMVSVLDGKLYFRVTFEELNDNSMWLPGWKDLKIKKDHKKTNVNHDLNNEACLHPSIDSGIAITSKRLNLRDWFPE